MELKEVMAQLESMGSEQTKKVFMKHGAKEPFFGVKVADLKVIQKKVKKDNNLALQLFDTGNGDAMYLAGLIADPQAMTKKDLQNWVKKASWNMISEYTVAWVAAESKYGWELALEWIDSDKDNISSSGWSTLGSIVAVNSDEDLDTKALKGLIKRVVDNIQSANNRTKYTMNSFLIAVGSYVKGLTEEAVKASKTVGVVEVNMGGTACKVPDAEQYIDKVKKKGYIGKKRKTAIC
ncbi:MAG: DNA alkylation repair protein [Chitinophagales bacterium]|nr:DNA alkylation repair protein [Chitinophagaceae bacterium]MCB9066091.1 DNA alkylation repair protein [Chitinophagales bacterium]